ncbi:MAG: MogA/MoaB family molybdenum cofactor biosynthesis protein, partial [Fusobacteriaceae bacterium]
MFTAAILCMSDKGSRGEREDRSTLVIEEILVTSNYRVIEKRIIPDDICTIEKNLIELSDQLCANLIITTGGTGLTERDNTPEATKNILHKEVPGIAEAIRAYSMTITKRAMLSRAVSGIRGKSLIINLPGSPKAVKESLEYIVDTLKHGMELINHGSQECGSEP